MTISTCGILKVIMTGMISQIQEVNFVLIYLYWMMNKDVFTFICRVVSLSLCACKECFISGSLDQTVLFWDQRAEKCQVVISEYRGSFLTIVILNLSFGLLFMSGSSTCARKACYIILEYVPLL